MSDRLIRAIATAAGVAAVLAYAVADAFAAMDRSLSTYAVEIPSVIPEWVQEDVDL